MIITEGAKIKLLELLQEHNSEGLRVFFAGFG